MRKHSNWVTEWLMAAIQNFPPTLHLTNSRNICRKPISALISDPWGLPATLDEWETRKTRNGKLETKERKENTQQLRKNRQRFKTFIGVPAAAVKMWKKWNSIWIQLSTLSSQWRRDFWTRSASTISSGCFNLLILFFTLSDDTRLAAELLSTRKTFTFSGTEWSNRAVGTRLVDRICVHSSSRALFHCWN